MSAIKWTSCGNTVNYGAQDRVRKSKKAGGGKRGEKVFSKNQGTNTVSSSNGERAWPYQGEVHRAVQISYPALPCPCSNNTRCPKQCY